MDLGGALNDSWAFGVVLRSASEALRDWMDMFAVCCGWKAGHLVFPSYIVVLIVKAPAVCGEDDGHGRHAGGMQGE